MQSIGHLAAEHLYVFDGDLQTQDEIAKKIKDMRIDSEGDAAQLAALVKGNPHMAEFLRQRNVWNKAMDSALAKSRAETVSNVDDRDGSRGIYEASISPAMDMLFTTMEQLQDSVEGKAHTTADERRGRPELALAPAADRRRRSRCCSPSRARS